MAQRWRAIYSHAAVLVLHSVPSPRQSPPLSNSSHHLMVLWIGRLFIEHLKRLPVQLGELAFEPHPEDLRHILPVIILHEQAEIVRVPKQGSLDGNLLHVIGLRDVEDLGRGHVGAGREVEIVAVAEHFKGAGTGRGRRCPEKDGMEFEDAGEAT